MIDTLFLTRPRGWTQRSKPDKTSALSLHLQLSDDVKNSKRCRENVHIKTVNSSSGVTQFPIILTR